MAFKSFGFIALAFFQLSRHYSLVSLREFCKAYWTTSQFVQLAAQALRPWRCSSQCGSTRPAEPRHWAPARQTRSYRLRWFAARLHLQVGFPNTGPWALLSLLIPVLLRSLAEVWKADVTLPIVSVLLGLQCRSSNLAPPVFKNPTCCFDSKRGWWSPRQLCPRAAVVEASRTSTPLLKQDRQNETR